MPAPPDPPSRRQEWPAALSAANRAQIIRGRRVANLGSARGHAPAIAGPSPCDNKWCRTYEHERAESRDRITNSARRIMDDIGNADRVALMHRLVQLKLEHRDLDGAVSRLVDDPAHDQLQ